MASDVSLADIFKDIPDILNTVPPALRIAALAIILFLILLVFVLNSVAFKDMNKKDRERLIFLIVRYSAIGTAGLCIASYAYGFVTLKSEAAELSRSITAPQTQTTKSSGDGSTTDVKPIVPSNDVTHLAESLILLSRKFNPPAGISDALSQLNAGNAKPALDLLQKKARSETDNAKRAETLRQLGLLAFYKDTQIALTAYQQSVELEPDSWQAWSQISYLLERQADHDGAKTAAQNAIAIGTARNDMNALGAGYAAVGYIAANLGQFTEAEESLEKARGYYLAAGAKEEYARASNNLARLDFSQGYYKKAIHLYDEALSYDNAMGNERGIASDYTGRAQARGALNGSDQVLDDLNAALAIDEKLNDLHQTAFTLSVIASIDQKNKNYDRAEESLTRALSLENQLGYKLAEAYDTGNLARIAHLKHNDDKAEAEYRDAIGLATEASPFAEAVEQRFIGYLYVDERKFSLAKDAFIEAAKIDRDLKQKKYLALDSSWLGKVYQELNQKSDACSSWKEAAGIYSATSSSTTEPALSRTAAENELAELKNAQSKMQCDQ